MGISISSGNILGSTIEENELNTTIFDDLAKHEIEIIELQANSTTSPLDHDTLVSDTFSDSNGYNNTVDTGLTDAIYDEANDKYADNVDTEAKWFKLNESSGSTLTDSGSDGDDATVTGATVGATGKLNNGLQFDATGEKIAFAVGSTNWTHTSAFSISFWIKVNATASVSIFRRDGAPATNNFNVIVGMDGSGNVTFTLDKYGSSSDIVTSTDAINDGAWHFVTCTYDGANNMAVYVDNGTADTGTYTQGAVTAFSGNHILQTVTGADFVIDDFRLHNAVYTSAQRSAIYNSGSGSETSVGIGTTSIIITLPTISGTVTATQLILRAENESTGSNTVTYSITDGTSTDSGLALDTKNNLSTVDGSALSGQDLTVSLNNQGGGTIGIFTYCLKMWKA